MGPTAVGSRAELAAVAYFRACGFEILGENVRVGHLEVDILLRDGPVVILAEVRTRGKRSWQRALDSIGAAKQARLRAAGRCLWASRFASDASVERMRFDAVAVSFLADGRASIEHVPAAF